MTQPAGNPHRKMRVLIADDIQETRRNTRLMLATIDDLEVVAIASPTPGNAEKLAQRYNIPRVFTDYKKMLKAESPDIISICLKSWGDWGRA